MKKRIAYTFVFLLLVCAAPAQPLGKMEREFRRSVGTLTDEAMGGRRAESRGDTLTAEYLRDHLAGLRGVELLFDGGVQSFTATSKVLIIEKTEDGRVFARIENGGDVSSFNVAGLIEGGDPVLKNEVILVGAHYDHRGMVPDDSGGEPKIQPGADDNASGTAMVMALAERLARERKQLRRSVLIVFFGAEESGILGSKYLTEHMPAEVPLEQVVYMVNFDMVGRLSAKEGLELYGKGLSEYVRTHPWPYAEVVPFDFYPEPGSEWSSDQIPFAKQDVPTVWFSDAGHTDYHRSSDTADKLNYRGMALVYRYALQLIRDLDRMPEILKP